jgi:hypothetical protein
MHRKFTLANELQHEPPYDNILEWKNTILTSLNELINLNLEDLSIKFKFEICSDLSSQVKKSKQIKRMSKVSSGINHLILFILLKVSNAHDVKLPCELIENFFNCNRNSESSFNLFTKLINLNKSYYLSSFNECQCNYNEMFLLIQIRRISFF